ncbi:MAG: TIGR03435 family protein [Acidobacteriota bacterium]
MRLGPLNHLIAVAYNVKGYQVDGASDSSQLYMISAKVEGPDAPTQEQARQMLQQLLADRFQLKLHRETRPLPVYRLEVGKSGLKMKPSPPGAKFDVSYRSGPNSSPNGSMEATLTTTSFVGQLTQFLRDRPIVDATGLQGLYDVKLHWSPDGTSSETPSIFTAVQEELGLKLEAAREPMEVLAVDSYGKPSEN